MIKAALQNFCNSGVEYIIMFESATYLYLFVSVTNTNIKKKKNTLTLRLPD